MDFDESIFEEFVLESQENLEAAEDSLSQLLKQEGKPDPELLDQVFRSVHSIKGAAGFLMLKQMEKLAYAMESLVSLLREDMKLTPEIGELVSDGIHVLNFMLDDVSNSNNIDITDIYNRLNQVIESGDSPESHIAPKSHESPFEGEDIEVRFEINPLTLKKLPAMHEFLYILEYDLAHACKNEGKSPVNIIKELLSVGIVVDAELIPPSKDLHEGTPEGPLWYIVLYSTILGPDFIDDAVGLPSERICSFDRDQLGDTDAVFYNIKSKKISLISSKSEINETGQRHQTPDYQESGGEDIYVEEASPSVSEFTDVCRPESIQIDEKRERFDSEEENWEHERYEFRGYMEKLDMLINLVGELVIAESMVTKNPNLQGLSLDSFERSAHNLRRIISELQNVVMSVRMTPMTKTFSRLSALVRDLSRKSRKRIALNVVGQETEVDNTIIGQISRPLFQLIHNCIEHGIEPPEQRKAAGKPETGTITLEARNEGGEILIFISDNGQGFSRDKIIERAVEQGIIAGDGSSLSYEEVCRLVFETSGSVENKGINISRQVSGMALVKKNIEKLKGRVDIQSSPGEGTIVILKIPLSLAIIDGMLIRVGKASYTLPMLSIRESFRPSPDQITVTMSGQELVRVRNNLIPVLRLHKLYNIASDHKDLDRGILISVTSGTKNVCFFADEIIGHHQTVIKSMPEYIGSKSGISGCTILDDGEIGLILDVGSIIEMVEI